ncbi:hypothetical protein ISR94_03005 [Candidatus Microgenomates bacterium]|nr:hypothetical protein [Candidatus Microgenomates bacterium]
MTKQEKPAISQTAIDTFVIKKYCHMETIAMIADQVIEQNIGEILKKIADKYEPPKNQIN